MFGAVAASSFVVNSGSSIAAVSPAGMGTGCVNVAVAGPRGTSPASPADRFTVLGLDFDGNGQTDGMTDGMIMIRYLFGFDDEALIKRVLGPGAARTDLASVMSYLRSANTGDPANNMFDPLGIGGDPVGTPGTIEAVILLRYLFGFTGVALTRGVISPGTVPDGSTRTTSSEIMTFLGQFWVGTDSPPPTPSKGPAAKNAARSDAAFGVLPGDTCISCRSRRRAAVGSRSRR
jgi:hypothetical protein